MNRPQLLIMDEPSTGLDPLVQRELQAMIREIAAEGRTVFLSSHTLSEVQRVADRVGIIRHGRLAAVEALADLRSKAIRRVELEFDSAVDAATFRDIPGVREVTVETTVWCFVRRFDGRPPADLVDRSMSSISPPGGRPRCDLLEYYAESYGHGTGGPPEVCGHRIRKRSGTGGWSGIGKKW